MADRNYGHGRGEGRPRRESSIFSDDDRERRERGSERWSSDYGRGRGGREEEERGFLERAGDEVRSWFGDEDAEQRRERDLRREEAQAAFASADYDRRFGSRAGYETDRPGGRERETGRDGDPGERRSRARSGYEDRDYGQSGIGGYGRGQPASRSDYGGRSGMAGRSHWDDDYQRWRDRQIAQFDQEYDEYRRERQERFDRDFDSWRSSRLTEGGFGAGSSGSIEENAGASTAGGGGTGSATRSSTGSTGAARADTTGAGATGAAGGEAASSRSRGRSRTSNA